MPSWKKLITSGSAASLSSITTSGDITIPATNKIYLDGGGNTYITEEVADQITLRAGGGNYLKVGTANGIIINDPGADLDTRIEGNTDQNLLFVDAGEDRVGIGTSSPSAKLHIYEGTGTTASSTGTSLFTLTNYVGADLNQQKTFIDFTLLDDNANETPQVRIGAEVGQNGDANSQEKEGSGAFVVYTNNADTTSGDAGASLAERMRVDYQGNVGIGESDPDSPLHFGSNVSSGFSNFSDYQILLHDTGTATTSYGIGIRSNHMIFNSDANYEWRSDNSAKMVLQSDGDLHLTSDVIAYSSTPSDKRLKDNVVTIGNSLDLVSQLRGVRFDWNIGSKKGQQDIGVIAQEVEQIIPEIVSEKKLPLLTGNDETIYKVVDYEKLTAVLIESIKELKQEVDEIKQKCDCLNK